MKLQLNFNKPDNYAFFCPASNVHLTLSNPVAFVDQTTPYIERGLKSKAIIDVTNENAGQKKKTVETNESPKAPTPSQKEESVSVEEAEVQPKEEPKEESKEESKKEAPATETKSEEKPKGKKGRPRKSKN